MSLQIEVPGEWDSVATLLAFADAVDSALPLTPDQSYMMRLVIEEIATNVVKYGYADGARDVIRVACAMEGRALRVTICDRGRPFDPREHAAPDLNADPATRPLGGLGLLFVREFSDTLAYTHDPASGWNELTVTRGP